MNDAGKIGLRVAWGKGRRQKRTLGLVRSARREARAGREVGSNDGRGER